MPKQSKNENAGGRNTWKPDADHLECALLQSHRTLEIEPGPLKLMHQQNLPAPHLLYRSALEILLLHQRRHCCLTLASSGGAKSPLRIHSQPLVLVQFCGSNSHCVLQGTSAENLKVFQTNSGYQHPAEALSGKIHCHQLFKVLVQMKLSRSVSSW